jgi:hypothetical protein
MLKIASKDVVKNLPKMEKTGKGIFGPCQLGKQTRAAHKKTLGILTSKNLELLHIVWNQVGIFLYYHSSTKWSCRKKEQGDSRDGSCNDPLKKSGSTFLR